MQSHIDEFRDIDAEVLAVSADNVPESANLARQLNIGFPLLSDSGLRAIGSYGVVHEKGESGEKDIARPATFVIDRGGVIRWRDLTENWRIRVRPEKVADELRKIP